MSQKAHAVLNKMSSLVIGQNKQVRSRCLFLELASETRNQIYEEVVAANRHLVVFENEVIAHALARTCRRIREEFVTMFAYAAPKYPLGIMAHINDYDFSGLIEVISKFSEDKETNNRNIDLEIDIKVTLNGAHEFYRYDLFTWLAFIDKFDMPERHGRTRTDELEFKRSYLVEIKFDAFRDEELELLVRYNPAHWYNNFDEWELYKLVQFDVECEEYDRFAVEDTNQRRRAHQRKLRLQKKKAGKKRSKK